MPPAACPQCERLMWVPDGADWVCCECRMKASGPEVADEPESCPRCGRLVEAVFRFCPHCEAILQGADRGSRGGKLDDVVHRRGARLQSTVPLLAFLGFMGLVISGLVALGNAGSTQGLSLLLFVGGVFVLSMASFGVMLYRTRDNPSRRGMEPVVVGTLALAGALVTFSCVLGASIGLFFFAVCFLR
jgi:hypothetical protein